ncbi:MAG TPA: hypothetical protein VMT16_15160 [Thermoanaerobaculia bacterium]|nr:hypothetical protein [Thermoanaerobaculia bacterium]
MHTRFRHRFVFAAISLLAVACGRGSGDTPAATPQAEPAGAIGAGGAAAPPADGQATTDPATPDDYPTAEAPATAPAAGSPPAAAAAPGAPPASPVLAAQETNWPGIVAEVTEFRRKGNTLTARVRFRNQGTERAEPRIAYDEAYVMDLAAGRKYEVLRDERNRYIAALRSGWNDHWYDQIEPGQAMTIWMKLPAPPPEVREVTLQLPGVPPFEDLAIQDG